MTPHPMEILSGAMERHWMEYRQRRRLDERFDSTVFGDARMHAIGQMIAQRPQGWLSVDLAWLRLMAITRLDRSKCD
jgi:hypothetical protein